MPIEQKLYVCVCVIRINDNNRNSPAYEHNNCSKEAAASCLKQAKLWAWSICRNQNGSQFQFQWNHLIHLRNGKQIRVSGETITDTTKNILWTTMATSLEFVKHEVLLQCGQVYTAVCLFMLTTVATEMQGSICAVEPKPASLRN